MRIVCFFVVCLLVQGLHASVLNTFGQVVGSVGTKISSLVENIFFDVSHALEDQKTAEEWRKRPYVNRSTNNQVPQENGNITIQIIVSETETGDAKNPSVEKETQNTNVTVTKVTPEKVDTIEIDQIMTNQAQTALTSKMLLKKIIEESGNEKCNVSKIIKKVYSAPSNNNNTIEIAEVDKICYTTEIKPHSTSTNSDQQTNATRPNPSEKVKIKEVSIELNSGSYSTSLSGSYSGSYYSDSVSLEVNDNDKKNRDDILNQVAQLSQKQKSTGNNVHLITKLDIVNQMEPYMAKSIPKQTNQGKDKNSNFADNKNKNNTNVSAQNDEKRISIPQVKGDKNNETTNNSLILNQLNNTFNGKNINAVPMPIMFKSKFENPINITTDKATNSTEASAGASKDSTGTIENHLKKQTGGDNIVTQAVNLKSVGNSDAKLNSDDKLDLKQSNNIGKIENIKSVEGDKVGVELQISENAPVKNISNKTNHNAESESLNSTSDKSVPKSVPTEHVEKPRYAKSTNETDKGKKNSQRPDIESTHLSGISNEQLFHLPTQQTENKKKESIKNKNDLFSVVSNLSGSQIPSVKALHNEEPDIRADTSVAQAVNANNDKEKNNQSYSNTFLQLENKGSIKTEHENVPTDKTDTILLEPLALKIDEDPIEDNKPVDLVTRSDVTNVDNDKMGESDKQKYENPENKNKFKANGINHKESTAEDMKDNNKYSFKDSVKSSMPEINGVKLSNEFSDHGQPSTLPENDSVGPDKNTESNKTEIDKPTDMINNEKNLQNNQTNEENFENNKKISNEESSDMKIYPEDVSEKKKLNDKLNDKIKSDLRPDSKDKSTKLNNVIRGNEETSDAEKVLINNLDDNDGNRSVGGSSLDINKNSEQNNIPSITDINKDEGISDLDENSKYKLGDNENTNDEVETVTDNSKDIPDNSKPVDYDTISEMETAVDESTDGLPNLETGKVANNEEISDAESNFQDQLDNQNNEAIANNQDLETAKGLSTLDNDDIDDQNTENVKEGQDETGNEDYVNIDKTENTDRVADNPSDKVDKNNEVDIENSDLDNNYRDKSENQNDEQSIPTDPPVSVDDLDENDEIGSEPNAADPDVDTVDTNSLDDNPTSYSNYQETNDAEGNDDENYQDSS